MDAVGEEEGGARVVGEGGEWGEELAFGFVVKLFVVELSEPGQALGEGDARIKERDVAGETWLSRKDSIMRNVRVSKSPKRPIRDAEPLQIPVSAVTMRCIRYHTSTIHTADFNAELQ